MIYLKDLENYCGYYDDAHNYVVEVSADDVNKILKDFFKADEVIVK